TTPLDRPQIEHYTSVLNGGGIASYYAITEITKLDPEGTILLIGDEEIPPYWRPALAYDLWFEPSETLDSPDFMNDLIFPLSSSNLTVKLRRVATVRRLLFGNFKRH